VCPPITSELSRKRGFFQVQADWDDVGENQDDLLLDYGEPKGEPEGKRRQHSSPLHYGEPEAENHPSSSLFNDLKRKLVKLDHPVSASTPFATFSQGSSGKLPSVILAALPSLTKVTQLQPIAEKQ